MKEPSPEERFEMLDAGRALGDLSPEEEAEWSRLAESFGAAGESEISLDAIVGALESQLSPSAEIPEACAARIANHAKQTNESDERSRVVTEIPSFAGWRHPALGWSVAAGFLILLGLTTLREDAPRLPASPTTLAAELDRDAAAIRLTLSRPADAADVGTVLWSDDRQEGVLLLRDLPPNVPTKSQYQLWIVDADRDDKHPVDGGVFNVSRGGGTVAIRIDAKLQIRGPSAFVITEEQPGGVVVSKQEKVVAVAQL